MLILKSIFYSAIYSFLVLGNGASAAAASITVDCPPVWPGADDPKAKFDGAQIWQDVIMYGPPDKELAAPKARFHFLTFLDRDPTARVDMRCFYAEKRQLTIQLPGEPQHCEQLGRDIMERGRPSSVTERFFCVTNLRPGEEWAGPVYLLADPVDLHSALEGYGLRRSPEEILALARERGDRAEMVTESADGRDGPAEIRVQSSKGLVSVLFARETGLSWRVSLYGKNLKEDVHRFVDEAYLKFGTQTTYGREADGSVTIWDRGRGVRVEYREAKPNKGEPSSLYLIDKAAAEAGHLFR